MILACTTTVGATETGGAKPLVDESQKMDLLTKDVTQGALRVVQKDGGLVECPLKHTDVQAEVSGFVARVKVTQTFFNPLNEKIEAVYVFPLPHKAAVDDMTMVLSSGRRIVGVIKRRGEARQIYEQALAQGATAALLEQERPNIFTQSVGNINPQEEVKIEISYVDVLDYDMGIYEFHFPMVVGPRYIPGGATSTIPPVPPELQGKVGEIDKTKVKEGAEKPKGDGWAPDTTRVPDASRITPPVLKPGFRNGHDISLSLTLEAGVPIRDLKVVNHKAAVDRNGQSAAKIVMAAEDNIANKDFVVRYGVVGEKPEMALLTHTDPQGQGYFLLMIQPKDDPKLRDAPPREIVFLVDVSGSMSGQPTAKVREAMAKLLKLCKPEDTLQVVSFAGSANKFFPNAVPANAENIAKAVGFVEGFEGSGGTEMLKGIRLAIGDPPDGQRVRVIIMLTDGYIGNEAEIIAEVGKRCGDQIRFWAVGIGSSPNRFLIDGVARQGGGMGKYLTLNDDPQEMVQEMMMRIHRAQLSKVQINWGAAETSETFPARIPELWAGRPVVLFGRYQHGHGTVNLSVSGNVEGQPVSWPLKATFPAEEPKNAALAKVWARNKIEDLMQQTYYQGSPEVEDEVTQIALDYRLMSQYTSFVAVDESQLGKLIEPARKPRRMLVPVPIPEGTRYEGFFGGEPAEEVQVIGVGGGGAANMGGMAGFGTGRGGSGGSSTGSLAAPAAPAPPTMASPAQGQSKSLSQYGYPTSGGSRTVETLRKAKESGVKSRANDKASSFVFQTALSESDGKMGNYHRSGYSYQVLAAQADRLNKLAAEAIKQAEQLKKDGKTAEARATFTWACLLGDAVTTYSRSDGGTAAKALEALTALDEDRVKTWTKLNPAPEKRLNLVIRNQSLADAIAAVSKAAGLPIKVTPGSLEDAADMTGQKSVRVTFLDLRRATVAEALDWLVQPARLQWTLDNGALVVTSARRGDTAAPWVYDVSMLALPDEKALGEIKDYQERITTAGKAAEEFLKAVTSGLGLKDDAVAWYAPGQLVIVTDARTHEAAAKLFADLASADAKLAGDLAALQKVTASRAAERKESMAKIQASAAKTRVAQALEGNSWRLLAGAAGGEIDLEALTELQAAWQDPVVAELLKGPQAILCLRSAWAIAESARALPKETELAALANSAKASCRKPAEEAAKALEKAPQDYRALLTATYAALTFRDDAELAGQLKKTIESASGNTPPVSSLRTVGLALMGSADGMDRKALAGVLNAESGVQGGDLTVLTALACRKAGGDTWGAFRAESRNILGHQPLDGAMVILVNRLTTARLPLVAATK
jgi:Ca-activated chloride channel family protein